MSSKVNVVKRPASGIPLPGFESEVVFMEVGGSVWAGTFRPTEKTFVGVDTFLPQGECPLHYFHPDNVEWWAYLAALDVLGDEE